MQTHTQKNKTAWKVQEAGQIAGQTHTTTTSQPQEATRQGKHAYAQQKVPARNKYQGQGQTQTDKKKPTCNVQVAGAGANKHTHKYNASLRDN